MGNSGPRVAPDGVLIDHVAEFVYERPERLKTLFSRDEDGYIDAVLRLVQTIAVGGTIVGSERPGATECTDKLKGALYESGGLEYVDFFNEEERRERLDSANRELGLKWNTICGEFANDRAGVSIALLGHMRREFQYYWRGWDPQWKSEWYSPANEALPLPAAVKQRILHEILMLASQYRMKKDETGLGNWIERCVTTHYRIFFEYWLYLGKRTGAEYMPALTRSSLRCIRDSNTAVDQLVLPFVALAAVKNVKTRGDLIKRVVDWTDGPGRRVVEGLRELQGITRLERDHGEEKKILAGVRSTLSSEFSRGFSVTLNLLRPVMSAGKGCI